MKMEISNKTNEETISRNGYSAFSIVYNFYNVPFFSVCHFHVPSRAYIFVIFLYSFCCNGTASRLLLVCRLLVSYLLLLLERITSTIQYNNTTIPLHICIRCTKLSKVFVFFFSFSFSHLTWQLDALLLMPAIEQTPENEIKGG